jgi:hypothetical protein
MAAAHPIGRALKIFIYGSLAFRAAIFFPIPEVLADRIIGIPWINYVLTVAGRKTIYFSFPHAYRLYFFVALLSGPLSIWTYAVLTRRYAGLARMVNLLKNPVGGMFGDFPVTRKVRIKSKFMTPLYLMFILIICLFSTFYVDGLDHGPFRVLVRTKLFIFLSMESCLFMLGSSVAFMCAWICNLNEIYRKQE